MKNEATPKQNNLPAKQNNLPVNAEEWGIPTGASQDMVIPKILAQQGLSKFVVERKAMMGEFRDSISGKLLGSIDAPMVFIPFFCQKIFDIRHQQSDGQFKYVRSEPVIENPLDKGYNDNLPWESEEKNADGKLVKCSRVRRLNFFVLLPEEIKSKIAMPYVLSFKSTSLKEGKKLWTAMYIRNFKAGVPPAAYMFSLGGKVMTNEKGSFVVPDVAQGRQSTSAELQECLTWLKVVRGSAVKVDNSDIVHEQEVGAADDLPF